MNGEPPKNTLELSGTYNHLTVVAKTEKRSSKGAVMWLFKCTCGQEVLREGTKVKNGHTISCGCVKRSSAQKRRFEAQRDTRGAEA